MNQPPSDRPREDLTARARVRDVALRLFAERGVAGTTIRGVADAAGVSTGLVQHHFRSKAGLRQACDDYAIRTLLDQARQAAEGETPEPGFVSRLGNELSMRYLARALVDGSSAAAELFDSGAALAESWLSARWPDRFPPGSARLRDAAAVMSALHLGPIALHQHLSRRMGVAVLESAHTGRITAGMTDVYRAMASYLDSAEWAEVQAAAGAPVDHTSAERQSDE